MNHTRAPIKGFGRCIFGCYIIIVPYKQIPCMQSPTQTNLPDLKCTEMLQRPGLRPGPRCGSLHLSPDYLSGFWRVIEKRGRGEGMVDEGMDQGKVGQELGSGRGGRDGKEGWYIDLQKN